MLKKRNCDSKFEPNEINKLVKVAIMKWMQEDKSTCSEICSIVNKQQWRKRVKVGTYTCFIIKWHSLLICPFKFATEIDILRKKISLSVVNSKR